MSLLNHKNGDLFVTNSPYMSATPFLHRELISNLDDFTNPNTQIDKASISWPRSQIKKSFSLQCALNFATARVETDTSFHNFLKRIGMQPAGR